MVNRHTPSAHYSGSFFSFLRCQAGGSICNIAVGGLAITWVLALFAAFGPLKALLLAMPLTSLGDSSFAELNNQAVWWQMAARVSRGMLFPTAPALAESAQGVAFYPYLSLWVHGLAIALLGAERTALIGATLLPSAAFFLLTLIYRHFVGWRWAIWLSSVGLIAFSGFPFRAFLIGLLEGKGWMELAQSNPPDIVQFPFPALSLVAFAAVFLASIRRIRLSPNRVTVLTVLWGLQAYVHILNAFIGIIFWLSFLAVRLHRQEKDKFRVQSVRQLIMQVAILLGVTSLALIGYGGLLQDGFSSIREPISDQGMAEVILVGYLVLPLILLAAWTRIQPIDMFELRTKFLPVWVLLASEVFLLLLHASLGIGPSAGLVSSRLGMFFIHPFSFVPLIYYATRPGLSFGRLPEGGGLGLQFKKALEWFFRDASYVYLPLLYVLLSFYAIASARYGVEDARHGGQAAALAAEAELGSLASIPVHMGDTAVVETPNGNLLLPLRTGFGSLWVSRFANQIPEAEAIERLALYARLVGWSEDRFLAFMEPQNQDFSLSRDRIILTNQTVTPGVGYWLVHHYAPMGSVERERYRARLRKLFVTLDVAEALKRYGVSVLVLSQDRVPSTMSHNTVPTAAGLLITIE